MTKKNIKVKKNNGKGDISINIEDNDDIEDDANEPYCDDNCEEECNIDDIEPSEPSNEV